MAISEDFLSQLNDKADIENIVSQYVNLRRRGRTLTGLCPFHSEKTPSFTVYPENNSFYCFGCGAGGDTITFIRRIENLDYVDAVKSLASRLGMTMPDDGWDDSLSKRRNRILAANREAAKFYHTMLFHPQGREVLAYLSKRALSRETITHFGLGCAPNSWDALLKHLCSKGFTPEELLDAGLVKQSTKSGRNSFYDNFRNKVMYPIIDLNGNVIAFGGRVLDDSKPKYINTSDTIVFKKSQTVFGLNFAKNTGTRRLILTEGYMDTIALHQAGFTEAVACLGTALPAEQVRLLRRYADEVIVTYDSDGAGQKATARAMEALPQAGMKLRVLRVTGGKDPDEIIREHGPERFRQLLDGASNDTEYKILAEREKYDVSTDDGKLNFLRGAVNILAAIESLIEREIYISRIAGEFSVSKDAIAAQVKEAADKRISRRRQEKLKSLQHIPGVPENVRGAAGQGSIRAIKAQERLISILMNNPDYYNLTQGRIAPEDFPDEFYARVYSEIINRLSLSRRAGIAELSMSFTPDEMSRVTGIFVAGSQVGSTVEEFGDCINVLIDEKNKRNTPDPASLEGEDFNKLFKNIKNT